MEFFYVEISRMNFDLWILWDLCCQRGEVCEDFNITQ